MTSKLRKLFAHIYLPGSQHAVPAGVLSLIEDAGSLQASQFVYGLRYAERANALSIDPLDLPLPPPEQGATYFPGRGLTYFGAIRDAAPDTWGRRVIENKLKRAGPLSEFDYLLHAGPNRVGALDFRRDAHSPEPPHAMAGILELDYLLATAERIEAGEQVPASMERFLEPGSSMGGARPKAVVVADGKQWLAKFPARGDRFDVPAVEFATLLLAARAGLNVPEVRLHKLENNRSVMLIERFDRVPMDSGFSRRHFVSALTLLGKHEQESLGASYLEIVAALSKYGFAQRLAADCAELFRRMIFNIMVSNDDDHLRNHGFLWENRGYVLSPLYDVVPHPQHATERFLHLVVGREGRLATLTNALSQCEAFSITLLQAKEIIEQITTAIAQWRTLFADHGVSAKDIATVASAFQN